MYFDRDYYLGLDFNFEVGLIMNDLLGWRLEIKTWN